MLDRKFSLIKFELETKLRDMKSMDKSATIAYYKAVRSLILQDQNKGDLQFYSTSLYQMTHAVSPSHDFSFRGQLMQALIQEEVFGDSKPLKDLKTETIYELKNQISRILEEILPLMQKNKDCAKQMLVICDVFKWGEKNAEKFAVNMLHCGIRIEKLELEKAEDRAEFIKFFDDIMFKVAPELKESMLEQKLDKPTSPLGSLSHFAAVPDRKNDTVKQHKKLLLATLEFLCDKANIADKDYDTLVIQMLKSVDNNLEKIQLLTQKLIAARTDSLDFSTLSKLCDVSKGLTFS